MKRHIPLALLCVLENWLNNIREHVFNGILFIRVLSGLSSVFDKARHCRVAYLQ